MHKIGRLEFAPQRRRERGSKGETPQDMRGEVSHGNAIDVHRHAMRYGAVGWTVDTCRENFNRVPTRR
jgi:hypothetical protein